MNVMLSKTMVKIQRNNEFIKIDAEKKWIHSSDSIETCAYLHNEDILFVLNTFRKIGKEGYDCWGGVKEVIEHNEDDFIIDGFSVRRFCDIKNIEIKNDKCIEIIKCEGVLDNITIPEIDITNWYSTFLSLLLENVNTKRRPLSRPPLLFKIYLILLRKE